MPDPSSKVGKTRGAQGGAVTEVPERRGAARYPFTATAELVELKTGTRLAARTSDLSREGCYVDSLNPFGKGTIVTLRLSQANKHLEAQAEVVIVHQHMGMGVLFTKVDPRHRAVLDSWIRELSGQQLPPAAVLPKSTFTGDPLQNSERYILSELINLLIRKHVITEPEGSALLQELLS